MTGEPDPAVTLAVPADAVVAEFPEPVHITGPDGSGITVLGVVAWDGADGPDDECEGAP